MSHAASPPRRRVLLVATVVAILTLEAALFAEVAWVHPTYDFREHAKFALAAADGGRYPGHPLYHLLLNGMAALAGRGGDLGALLFCGFVVMTAAVAAKLLFADLLARESASQAGLRLGTPQRCLVLLVTAFASATPNWWYWTRIYRGQFSANLWFNPTTILLMPFAAAFLWLALRSRRTGPRSLQAASALLAVSAVAKFSFAIACVPAIGLAALCRKTSWRTAFVLAAPVCVVVAAATLAYRGDASGSGVQFGPFAIWKRYTPTIPGSLLVSFAFPAAVTLLRPAPQPLRDFVAGAWALTGIAVLQFALFLETGARTWHANFYWGAHVATFLLFVLTATGWIARPAEGPAPRRDWRDIVCGALLFLHLAGGAMHMRNAWIGLGWKP